MAITLKTIKNLNLQNHWAKICTDGGDLSLYKDNNLRIHGGLNLVCTSVFIY